LCCSSFPVATDAISGIVGSGGNVDAVDGEPILKPKGSRLSFLYIGLCVVAISFNIALAHFKKYGSTVFHAPKDTAVVEEGDEE
jgi:hypothetical protein